MLQNELLKTSRERLEEFSKRIARSEMFDIEDAKFDISEHIFLLMERQKVSKAKLARRMGKSRAYVTKMLQGNANFTLESLVKIARSLECKLDVSHVLVPTHQEIAMVDWAQDAKPTVRNLGVDRAERDYIRLVRPPEPKSPRKPRKEKVNAPFATAA